MLSSSSSFVSTSWKLFVLRSCRRSLTYFLSQLVENSESKAKKNYFAFRLKSVPHWFIFMIMWNFIEVCDLISFWKWPPVGCMTASSTEHCSAPLRSSWKTNVFENNSENLWLKCSQWKLHRRNSPNIPLQHVPYQLLPIVTYVRRVFQCRKLRHHGNLPAK